MGSRVRLVVIGVMGVGGTHEHVETLVLNPFSDANTLRPAC